MFYGDIDNSGEILIQKPASAGSIGINQLVKDLNSANGTNNSNNSTFSTSNNTCTDCIECQPYGIAGYLLGLLAFGTVVPMFFGTTTRATPTKKKLKKSKDVEVGGTTLRKKEGKSAQRKLSNYRKKTKNDNITINVN